jgi:plasmid stabilization system protein ParE
MNEDKFILSQEAAEAEIKKIFDYYEIDANEIEDKDQKKFIIANYDRMIKAARLGRLEVKTEKGIEVIQHLRGSDDTVIYKEIDGNAKVATAGKETTDMYGRIYAVQGSLTGLGETAIRKMKGVDLSLCEVLGAIFLSA